MGKNKNMWNSLKLWLAGTLAAGSMMIPNSVYGGNDRIKITNNSEDNVIINSGYSFNQHSAGSLEGYDLNDVPWSTGPPAFESYNQWLKIDSLPYGVSLHADRRPP